MPLGRLPGHRPDRVITSYSIHYTKLYDYLAAARSYAESKTATGYYNRGNALAFAGDLDGALAAYQAALSLEPQHKDALHNRGLIRQWLHRQTGEAPGTSADAA